MNLGKILILFGVVILVAGLIITFFPKLNFFGKLPGDFKYETDNVKIYVPIVTSLIISIVLSLLFWLISFIFRK